MEATNYSQNNEQAMLLQFFGSRTGRLLDIGAYLPNLFSNSRALLDAGWSGVLVEPSPAPFQALLKHYGENPKVTLLHAAIAPTDDLIQFYDSDGDAISTCSRAHLQKWHTTKFSTFFVYTLPLARLFRHFGTDFDFINIDVESTNIELFRALPFELLTRTGCICVEHDSHQVEMKRLAQKHGFEAILENAENLIFARI